MNHRRWYSFLLLIKLRYSVKCHLYTLPLLRGTAVIMRDFLLILLKGDNCIKAHKLGLDLFRKWLLSWCKAHVINWRIGAITVSIFRIFSILSQKGSLIRGFPSTWTKNITYHLLLIIGDLNMCDLAQQDTWTVNSAIVILLSMRHRSDTEPARIQKLMCWI